MQLPTQVISSGNVEQTIKIDEKPHYVFGRAADVVDVPLTHDGSSREHAALVHHQDGNIYVIDLKSVGIFFALRWLTVVTVVTGCGPTHGVHTHPPTTDTWHDNQRQTTSTTQTHCLGTWTHSAVWWWRA